MSTSRNCLTLFTSFINYNQISHPVLIVKEFIQIMADLHSFKYFLDIRNLKLLELNISDLLVVLKIFWYFLYLFIVFKTIRDYDKEDLVDNCKGVSEMINFYHNESLKSYKIKLFL